MSDALKRRMWWRYGQEQMGYVIWRFPTMGVPQNGGFIRENLIRMHDKQGYKVVPPSYKLVYKPHEYYSYKYDKP